MEPEATAEVNDFGCVADVYDQLVEWAPYELWVDDLERRLRSHGLPEGARLLDVACGTGLSTIPWAQRGYEAVGVDISPDMLERARDRAAECGCSVTFRQGDMLDLQAERPFDAVICMHSGLDYLPDDEALRRAFRSARGCLRQAGLFSFDKCLDEPSFYQDDYSEVRILQGGWARIHYRWNRSRRQLVQRCVVHRTEGQRLGVTVVEYHLSATPPDDLHRWVEEAGFEMLEPVEEFDVPDPGMGIFRAV